MTESQSRLPADNPTVLLGVVTIVSGVATGLFADLRPLGQVIGFLAFAARGSSPSACGSSLRLDDLV
jgi:hypothetical protein